MEDTVVDSQADDVRMLHLIAQHDPDALEALYHRHAQTIYPVIVRIVEEPAVAEEVLQDMFWQIWCKAGTYQGDGTVAAWLYRIARNKSLDQLRRQRARPGATISLEQTEYDVAAARTMGSTVERETEHAWQQHQVRQALANLPDDQRRCLELAYFEDMTQRQIAETTSTPLGTIKTRLRLGMAKLERLLRAAGYSTDDL